MLYIINDDEIALNSNKQIWEFCEMTVYRDEMDELTYFLPFVHVGMYSYWNRAQKLYLYDSCIPFKTTVQKEMWVVP